jgi:hypothetical protein
LVLDFGFLVMGFGFGLWFLGFGFWVLGFGHWVLVSGFGYNSSGFRVYRVQSLRFRVLTFKFWFQFQVLGSVGFTFVLCHKRFIALLPRSHIGVQVSGFMV